MNIFHFCFLVLAVLLLASPLQAAEQVSDAQLLAAKENTIKVARMAAQMGAISQQEAAELERKISPMNAQQFKAYLEAEAKQAEQQKDISGGKVDEAQFKKMMEQLKSVAPAKP